MRILCCRATSKPVTSNRHATAPPLHSVAHGFRRALCTRACIKHDGLVARIRAMSDAMPLHRAMPSPMSNSCQAMFRPPSAPEGAAPPTACRQAQGGGRQDKRSRHVAARKAGLHMGLVRHAQTGASCCEGTKCRVGIDESACLPRAASCSGRKPSIPWPALYLHARLRLCDLIRLCAATSLALEQP